MELFIRDQEIYEGQMAILKDLGKEQLTTSITLLLKNQLKEVVGGIKGLVFGEHIIISKFHLCHEIRGYSYGSILINELIKRALSLGVTQVDVATNFGYIKDILRNNQFAVIEENAEVNPKHPTQILSRKLTDYIPFQYRHEFEIHDQPSEADLTTLRQIVEQEHKNYRRERLSPFNFFAKEDDQFFYLFGYRLNHILFVDYYYQPAKTRNQQFHYQVAQNFKAHLQHHEIKQLHLCDGKKHHHDYLLSLGFNAKPNDSRVYLLNPNLQFS